jgi:hypothetical protein
MSQYDALTGVKRRVRGMKAVRYRAMQKAAGINIIWATAARKARLRARRAENGLLPLILLPFPFLKERICASIDRLGRFALPRRMATADVYQLAA